MAPATPLRWVLLLACGGAVACMPQSSGGPPTGQSVPGPPADAGLETFEVSASGEVYGADSAPPEEPSVRSDAGQPGDTEPGVVDAGGAETDTPGADAGTWQEFGSEPDANSEACGGTLEQEGVRLTNEQRRAAGLAALECDPDMTRAARSHSEDMCARRYFAHSSPEGWTVVDRLREQGVVFRLAGENLGAGGSAEWVVGEWMRSEGHRRNILTSAFGRVGIGYVNCGGYPIWTQNFAD